MIGEREADIIKRAYGYPMLIDYYYLLAIIISLIMHNYIE